VLSGYLATTYGVKSDFPTFIVNRIARVFPLHVIVLTAMVAGIIVMRQFGFFPENEDFFSLRALSTRMDIRAAVGVGCLFLLCDVILFESTGFPHTGFGAIARGLLAGGMMLRIAAPRLSLSPFAAPLPVCLIAVIVCSGNYEFGVLPAAALICALGAPVDSVVHRTLSSSSLQRLGLVSFSTYLYTTHF
jgi:peptidoglycan/LPS O-acetylase OafA/YrhL